jgi:ribulose-phosphate 3-epimerase
MLKIIPSILTSNPQELKELINQAEEDVDSVSIDIIDGVYADNKTIDPTALRYIDTNLRLDFQLMTKEPINWVEKCASANAERIIGHVEMMQSQIDFVAKVQETGALIGLGLDLNTSIEQIDKSILYDLDVILVMSVPAGFGGQEFQKDVLSKIEKLAQLRKKDNSPFQIQVDGGVNEKNIGLVAKAGADEVSIGRSLFKGGNIKENIDVLLSKVEL